MPTVAFIARQALDLPPTASLVLFSGHSAFKDMNTTQQALSRVQAETLHLLGLGQVNATGPWGQGQLIPPGYIQTPAQMAGYYRAADLYLHCATADSFPTAILEALACGMPVVATAVGGIPEQIVDGVTGRLTPPNAPHAMVGAIQTLLDDAALRRQMGQAAAVHVRQHFGLAQQVEQFLAWYEEVYEDWQISERIRYQSLQNITI